MVSKAISIQRMMLAVYIVCFSVGAGIHAADFLERGLRPYAGIGPLSLEVFWTLLIVLDLIAVTLLWSGRRRAGLSVALFIMAADVGANTYAMLGLGMAGLEVPLLLQSVFLGFVLGSIGFLWSRS